MRAPSRSSSSPYFLPQGAEIGPTSPVDYGAPSAQSRFENAVMESGLFTTAELSEDEDISPACSREESEGIWRGMGQEKRGLSW